MKKCSTAALFLLLSQILPAQDNYEIQVYGSQTQTKGTTMFESHSNFTFTGQKNEVEGVCPTHHAFHETIEITTGITPCFEVGFYVFSNYTPSYGFQIIGTHIRPRIAAPESWKLPFGLGLSAELGTQKAAYAGDTWSLELRPIIDKQYEKLYVTFNPTLGFSLKGNNQGSAPSFEPDAKIAYAFHPAFSLGVEYFGALGAVNYFEVIQNQRHALFLTFDLLSSAKWELNFGPGFGLTNAADKFVFKMFCGRRISW